MKNKICIWSIVLLVCCLSALLTSCKKKSEDISPDEENKEKENVPTGRLYMHLHNFIEDTEVDLYDVVYTSTSEGRKISLSMGQLYLSNIQLIKLDGSVYTVPNTIVLKEQEIETYLIGDVPVGNYKTIRFTVGLDANTNQKTPSTDANDPLNKPDMWFSSTAQPKGYVFVNVQGKIDTTADASGTDAQMQPFIYKIGTAANLMQRTMPDQSYTIVKDQAQYCHLYIDYTKLFTGIPLSNPANLTVNSPSDNASGLAAAIVRNIPTMFFYEE